MHMPVHNKKKGILVNIFFFTTLLFPYKNLPVVMEFYFHNTGKQCPRHRENYEKKNVENYILILAIMLL